MFNAKTHPYCYSGHNYALDVVSGKIPNSIYIVGACQRYLNDLKAKKYPFDADKAERYLRLVQKFEHVIGEWETPNIVYSPWQCWLWMNVIGFQNTETGFQRFRIAHIEVARGGGKSAMASQSALYFLALDTDKGNQIAATATRKEQARIVLDAARAMARKSHAYLKATGVKVLAHTIVQDKTNSKMVALSSDHSGLDGLNLRLAVLDELHAMRRETFDVIYSGMSKRKDSLTLCITTAGFDVDSVGYSQSFYAKKVATGEIVDEQFFSAVYTIDVTDDVFSEIAWKKANPGWAVSVDPISFAAKADKAKVSPVDLPNFKVKHLNVWLSEAHAYYDQNKWDLCADPELKIEDFKGKQCRIGVDIASRVDLTSVAYLFVKDKTYYFFDKSYVPEITAKEVNSDIYNNCIASGHLIATPGEAINQDVIRDQVLKDAKDYKVLECLLDPWNSVRLMQELNAKRIETTEFRMTVANLSEATKTLDELIRTGRVKHNGSPLLRWSLGNVVAKEDANGNVYPRKSHESLKIDPIVAMLMALAAQLQEEKKISVYDSQSRGLRII